MKSIKAHNVASAWFGVIAAAVFATSWIAAVALEPSWIFGENTLSELGISENGAATFFNYGCCMLSAIFLAAFGFSMAYYAGNKCSLVAGIFTVLAAASLFFVGVVPMDVGTGDLHNYLAYLFAFFEIIAIILYAGGFYSDGRIMLAAIPIIALCVIMGVYVGYGVEMFEAVGAVGLIACICTAAAGMMMSKPSASIN
jgi:hypothetical membrane protein